MAVAKCIFCGLEEEDFRGTYLFKNDGSTSYYCSSKCRKNHLKLGRDKRKMRWTEAFHEQRAKSIAAKSGKADQSKAEREMKDAKKAARKGQPSK